MKFLCIFFAAGVSFSGLFILDTIAAQVKRYEKFDDFLTDVKTTADSLLDYVSKMQALLCPNQPVCSAEGELERKDVLGALPAVLSVGSFTINIEDVANSVDVCCLPCSCSDSCRQDDNCCPTKQMFPDISKNTTAVEQECIAATVVSYRNKLSLDSSHVNHMYRMVTSCFHDNTNLTLVNKCLHPDTDAFSENLPVTSQITGYTYWNKPCAMCNDDDDDVIEWTPNVLIKTNIPYFSNYSNKRYKSYPDTYEKLSNLLNPRFSDIIYTPPLSIRLENRICLIEEWVPRPDCRQTLEVESLSTSDWLFESCRQFKSPVQHGLRRASTNIFCYVCHKSLRFVTNKQSCRTVGLPKASPGYLTALFNYKLEPDPPASNANRLIAEGKCNCAEMFDPYLVLREPHCEKKMSSGFSTRSETTLAVQPLKMKVCRPLYCPAGEIQAACGCIQPFHNLSGMPVVLMAKVTSRQEGSDSLTSGQLRKLHTTLKKALETIAVNTTADIAATLKQENMTSLTYLCIIIAHSDPGVDTKLAMKPFLRYLDTDDVLKLAVGKLDFAAALTTKARLWIDQSSTEFGSVKACCLEQKPNSLVQVFANQDTMNSGSIMNGIYQSMSRLLYCKQLELDQSEQFITNTGIVNVNVTEPMIAISDYYQVSQSRVRICADMYVPNASGKGKKSIGALCASSVELIISSLLLVIVACMIVSK